jgi:hypothetical protein
MEKVNAFQNARELAGPKIKMRILEDARCYQQATPAGVSEACVGSVVKGRAA